MSRTRKDHALDLEKEYRGRGFIHSPLAPAEVAGDHTTTARPSLSGESCTSDGGFRRVSPRTVQQSFFPFCSLYFRNLPGLPRLVLRFYCGGAVRKVKAFAQGEGGNTARKVIRVAGLGALIGGLGGGGREAGIGVAGPPGRHVTIGVYGDNQLRQSARRHAPVNSDSKRIPIYVSSELDWPAVSS